MKGGFYSRREISGVIQKIRSPNMPFGAGKVFFVDGQVGSDGYDGDDPEKPLATITRALVLCVADRDDYIIVLRGGGQTYPILIDKNRVHLVGVTNRGTPHTVSGYVSGDAICLNINADHVEIAGLQLLADATHPSINILGQCWGLWVHHCTFRVSQYGIYCAAAVVEGPVGGLIEDNIFDETLVDAGISLYAPTRSVIRNNIFKLTGAGAVGIHIAGPGQFGAILDNVFACEDVAGAAITITSGVTVGGLVAGNVAANGKLATFGAGVVQPFTDGGTNHWDDNRQNCSDGLAG